MIQITKYNCIYVTHFNTHISDAFHIRFELMLRLNFKGSLNTVGTKDMFFFFLKSRRLCNFCIPFCLSLTSGETVLLNIALQTTVLWKTVVNLAVCLIFLLHFYN